jgi:hypothetical protein
MAYLLIGVQSADISLNPDTARLIAWFGCE